MQEFTPRDLEFSPQVAECDMVLYTVGTHNEKQAFAEFLGFDAIDGFARLRPWKLCGFQEICKAYQPDVVVDRRRLVGSLTYCKVGSRLRIVPESWFG